MTKLLMVLMIALSSIQAFATEVKVHEEAIYNYREYEFFAGDFGVNKDMGRAWVTLNFHNSDTDGTDLDLRAQVKGMKFDKTTREVVIETETGRIVCAVEKKFLGIRSMRKTKDCTFREEYKTVTVDNGYEVEKFQKRMIYLVY